MLVCVRSCPLIVSVCNVYCVLIPFVVCVVLCGIYIVFLGGLCGLWRLQFFECDCGVVVGGFVNLIDVSGTLL